MGHEGGSAAVKSSSVGGDSSADGSSSGSGSTAVAAANGLDITSPPSFVSNSSLQCDQDTFKGSTSGYANIRKDHPRLVAPASRWACIPKLIKADPTYMGQWNHTIFANATAFYNMPPTNYSIDGGYSGSGVLDVAREVQLRIKHWGYAYRMTNDTKWVDRTWLELQTASGNTSAFFGVAGDNWNTKHFLDVGEFTFAFALAYDWMYDVWTPTQKRAIMWSIIELGLQKGLTAYTAGSAWWGSVNGNWNCVINNGLTSGALAIADDDPTGIVSKILNYTIPSAQQYCTMAIESDGTSTETPNYWYFMSTGHSQLASTLKTAVGNDNGLMELNPAMKDSGLYHMYVTGNDGLFSYGDSGPNKYTATANALMLYGSEFNRPMYTLFQRDARDAPEPITMLWYDPQASGAWFNGLPLDHHFDSPNSSWVSTRSSWTDGNGIYAALKSSSLVNHQTHGDLDCGTFVFDAFGKRFAGEFGNGDYLSTGYFSNETQGSARWDYYRKATEGQNVIMLNHGNQRVAAAPTIKFGSTGEAQTARNQTQPTTSTAFVTTDLSTAYGQPISRGMRLLNGRTQMLLQDELRTTSISQWRMHTNATVTINAAGTTATLKLGDSTVQVVIQSPGTAKFQTVQPVRLATDPALPAGQVDQPNPGVTVLAIDIPAGSTTLQVLFNPQWPKTVAPAVTPPSVALANWSTTSHN